jgi:transposase
MGRDRFDHSVDHKVESKPARLQRIEVITGVERRRKWSPDEKLAVVVESLAEGAVVSEVARRHGISPQQLFGWRAKLRTETAAARAIAAPLFAPACQRRCRRDEDRFPDMATRRREGLSNALDATEFEKARGKTLSQPLGASYRLKLFDHIRVARRALRVCAAEFGALASIFAGWLGERRLEVAVL